MPRKPAIDAPAGHYGCTKCRQIKPLSEFYIKADGRPHPHCRPCKQAMLANPPPSKTVLQRFWAKVDKRGPDECWNWLGALGNWGYASLFVGGKHAQGRELAHRVSLRLHGVEVPPFSPTSLVVDHICRNRACVNPAHLRLVSQRVSVTENCDTACAINARKKTCKQGHPFDGVIRGSNGHPTRVCLTCWPASWRAVERYKQENC